MSDLALIGLGLGVAALFGGAALFLAYRLGKADEQKAIQRSDQEVKDAQLAAAGLTLTLPVRAEAGTLEMAVLARTT